MMVVHPRGKVQELIMKSGAGKVATDPDYVSISRVGFVDKCNVFVRRRLLWIKAKESIRPKTGEKLAAAGVNLDSPRVFDGCGRFSFSLFQRTTASVIRLVSP